MMPMTGLKFRSADTPANKTRPTIDFHTIIDSHALAIKLNQPYWFNAGLLHCSPVTHNVFSFKSCLLRGTPGYMHTYLRHY